MIFGDQIPNQSNLYKKEILNKIVTSTNHTSLVSHHPLSSHHALLLLLHEGVWARGPYGIL